MVDEVEVSGVNVAVIGAGSWGTALALHAARRGAPTTLWSRRLDHAEAIREERQNGRYLPGFTFPDNLDVTTDLGAASGADLVVVAVPSHGMRAVLGRLAEVLGGRADNPPAVLLASKGVEIDTLKSMADVAHEMLPRGVADRLAVLGGPSFAKEVAQGLPTVVVVASEDDATAGWIQAVLSGDGLRTYVTDDVVGVELGGAFKNVVAIAAGMTDGAGLGLNARAGLITRGLAEMTRLAVDMGANPRTLAGLAGLGDLVLTCTGGLSRNRRVGVALGEGRKLEEILEEMGMVAEGVKNTRSAYRLAHERGVEMPIVEMMHEILYGDLGVREAVQGLMQREPKSERA